MRQSSSGVVGFGYDTIINHSPSYSSCLEMAKKLKYVLTVFNVCGKTGK